MHLAISWLHLAARKVGKELNLLITSRLSPAENAHSVKGGLNNVGALDLKEDNLTERNYNVIYLI